MTTPPTIYSPINKKRIYESYLDGARWTVDNTEHRYQRLIDASNNFLIMTQKRLDTHEAIFSHLGKEVSLRDLIHHLDITLLYFNMSKCKRATLLL